MSRPILVDALSSRVGGGLTFIGQQLRALESVRPDIPLIVLASKGNEDSLKEALKAEVRTVKTPNVVARLGYEQTILPFAWTVCRLLYCPGNFCPIVKTRFPIVLTLQNALHFTADPATARSTVRRRIEIALAHASVRRADVVVAVSESLRASVIADGLTPDRIEVLPSGVPAWPEVAIKPAAIAEHADFVLSIAHDHPHKRLDDLVQAWGITWQRDEDFPELVLVGEVSESRRKALKQLASAAMHGRIRFLGAVRDRAEVKWLIRNARVLVSTSAVESFGLTLVEAASLGCPVIASDIPAHREVAASALFVPVGQPEVLAGHLAETKPRSDAVLETSQGMMTWEENATRLAEIFDRTSG